MGNLIYFKRAAVRWIDDLLSPTGKGLESEVWRFLDARTNVSK